MPCVYKTIAASALGLLLLRPGIASATALTQSFAIEVPSGTVAGDGVNVASSSFQQFDPAMGTLTEIQTIFGGTGSWNSSTAAPRLDLSLVTHGAAVVIGGEQVFFSPGDVQFSLGGTDRYLPELGSFIGPGAAQVDLRILGDGGTFSTALTEGSVAYVYEPQPAAIPEPGAVWTLCAGLLALAVLRRKRSVEAKSVHTTVFT